MSLFIVAIALPAFFLARFAGSNVLKRVGARDNYGLSSLNP